MATVSRRAIRGQEAVAVLPESTSVSATDHGRWVCIAGAVCLQLCRLTIGFGCEGAGCLGVETEVCLMPTPLGLVCGNCIRRRLRTSTDNACDAQTGPLHSEDPPGGGHVRNHRCHNASRSESHDAVHFVYLPPARCPTDHCARRNPPRCVITTLRVRYITAQPIFHLRFCATRTARRITGRAVANG